MKAIIIKENKSLEIESVPNLNIEEDEILIEVYYAAVNRADLMQREGNYPPPEGSPEWMGLEVSGRVCSIGKVAKEKSKYRINDEVCALLGGGGYAEYVKVKYDMLMPVPENCSLIEASSIPEAFCTAYLNLFIEGKTKKGDTLLMHAGASGLASVIIPMAKAFDINVITTVLSDEIAKEIKHLNADKIINTAEIKIWDELKRLSIDNKAVDVIIDCLGGEMMGKCLPYVNYGARWIMIATLAGDNTKIDLKNIYKKNIRIIGSTLRSKSHKFKADLLLSLRKDVWPKIENGSVKPTIYDVLPISQVEKAHKLLQNGKSRGKVVLKVKEDSKFKS